MEERYQLLEKIGEGGMGSVYRAHDTRMNREVAIKRIRTSEGGANREDCTTHIVEEAGSLASFQHPHIVTVYDVGGDEEGPYVVMEFIKGNTVDELIERAPLTWPDFRELAHQTQEALIAAQEHHLIHRDIKPSNLMLTWLPSGKFQIKIVDFGLARIIQEAVLDKEEDDAVLGSIFFMCPEQFERGNLDARADMYAMGCVYYYALTQEYPFNGKTGMEVMTAHLHHTVQPLQEVRPDLPRWVCDWVMWHINRQPADRPAGARESLKLFIQNENPAKPSQPIPQPLPQPASPPTMTTGPAAPSPDQPRRPRLIIPGAPAQPEPAPAPPPPPPPPAPPAGEVPEPPRTQTAPQPLLPPGGAEQSVHASPDPQPPIETPPPPPPPPPVAAPPPVAPPPPVAAPPPAAVAPPAAVLAPAAAPASRVPSSRLAMGPKATTSAGPAPGAPPFGAPQPAPLPVRAPKPGLSSTAKTVIVVVLSLLVVIIGIVAISQMGSNKDVKRYNEIIALAAKEDAKEIPVTKADFRLLINTAKNPGRMEGREVVRKAIFLAKSTDGTDLDTYLAKALTEEPMAPDIRSNLITHVVRRRNNPVVVPILMEFCRTTDDATAAVAAITACRFMAGPDELPKFVNIIEYTREPSIRRAAEENVAEILKDESARKAVGERVISAQATTVEEEGRLALTRLLGSVGGPKAEEVVKKALQSKDTKEQTAAIAALGQWADDRMFERLMDYLEKLDDAGLRERAFDAGFKFLSIEGRKRDEDTSEEFWKSLAKAARSELEQKKVITGLVRASFEDWAMVVLEYFVDEGKSDVVKDLAEKGISAMRARAKEQRGGGDEDEDEDEDADEDEDEDEDSSDESEPDADAESDSGEDEEMDDEDEAE